MHTSLELLHARVGHIRLTPKRHVFSYGVFYVVTPILKSPLPTPRFFSFDRWNLLSMYGQDNGARTDSSLREWIEETLREHAVELRPDDSIILIAHPRVFGYVFNPISHWLILDKESKLRAVLCEVHNTFGDDHNYLLAHADGRAISEHDVFAAKKHLYVSPFNSVPPGSYTFSFSFTDKTFSSHIEYFENDVHILTAHLEGTRTPMTTQRILTTLLTYPLMTLFIMYRIHLQALKLYFKGVPHTLSSRPEPTHGKTTRGESR